MELDKQVERMFQQSIAAKIDCADAVTPMVVRAGLALADCLLGDHRVLACGNGGSALGAQALVVTLMNQGERERPGLPVLLLDGSSAALHAIEQDYGMQDVLARQVRALGQPGDRLVLLTRSGTASSLLNAVTAAHERGMQVIAITAGDGGHLPALLDENDIEIRLPLLSRFRIYEMQILLSFALCELVEFQLFGEE